MASEKYTVEAFLKATDSGFSKTMNEAANSINDFEEKSEKASGKLGGLFKGLGSVAAGVGTAVAGVTATAAAAAGALISKVTGSYGEYEQLVGGVETLFGAGGKSLEEYAKSVGKSTKQASKEYANLEKAQDMMVENARRAYYTAGVDANTYMETATGFAASLISSLEGDTLAAATAADNIMVAMSDNANKMGTNIESIQNAYSGFAKQNYTMLDNLKLGYGGTKEEMVRLLEDAEKLPGALGQEFDLENFNDVTKAIQLIQESMGIAGVTVEEAEGTISGSLNLLSGAWTNLITDLGNGTIDISESAENVNNAIGLVLQNILPMVEQVVANLPVVLETLLTHISGLIPPLLSTVAELVNTVLSSLIDLLPAIIPVITDAVLMVTGTIVENLPLLIQSGIDILMALITGIGEMLPEIGTAMMEIIDMLIQTAMENIPIIISLGADLLMQIVNGIIDNLPAIIDTGLMILDQLIDGVLENIDDVMQAVLTIIEKLTTTITKNLPKIIEKGIEILMKLIDGILENLPQIIETTMKIIRTLLKTIIENLPKIIEAGIDVLIALIEGIIEALPMIIETVIDIIFEFIENIDKHLPKIIETGVRLLIKLGEGISKAIPKLLALVPQIFSKMAARFREINWASIGTNLVKGIWNGISNVTGWVLGKIRGFGQSILKGIKSIFGIRSPSKETAWMGEMLGKGLGLGVEDQVGYVSKMADKLSAAAMPDVEGAFDMNYSGSAIRGAVDLSASNIAMPTYEPEFTFKLGNRTLKGIRRDLTDAQTRELELVEVFG